MSNDSVSPIAVCHDLLNSRNFKSVKSFVEMNRSVGIESRELDQAEAISDIMIASERPLVEGYNDYYGMIRVKRFEPVGMDDMQKLWQVLGFDSNPHPLAKEAGSIALKAWSVLYKEETKKKYDSDIGGGSGAQNSHADNAASGSGGQQHTGGGGGVTNTSVTKGKRGQGQIQKKRRGKNNVRDVLTSLRATNHGDVGVANTSVNNTSVTNDNHISGSITNNGGDHHISSIPGVTNDNHGSHGIGAIGGDHHIGGVAGKRTEKESVRHMPTSLGVNHGNGIAPVGGCYVGIPTGNHGHRQIQNQNCASNVPTSLDLRYVTNPHYANTTNINNNPGGNGITSIGGHHNIGGVAGMSNIGGVAGMSNIGVTNGFQRQRLRPICVRAPVPTHDLLSTMNFPPPGVTNYNHGSGSIATIGGQPVTYGVGQGINGVSYRIGDQGGVYRYGTVGGVGYSNMGGVGVGVGAGTSGGNYNGTGGIEKDKIKAESCPKGKREAVSSPKDQNETQEVMEVSSDDNYDEDGEFIYRRRAIPLSKTKRKYTKKKK